MALVPDGGTINIRARGTITLTSGELVVDKSVIIRGPGAANLEVSGNGASRVFHIAPNTAVTISGLKITNGKALGNGFGGGIYNDHAHLTVSNCILSGNSAQSGGAIFNDGFSGTATLAINNGTLNNNSADIGGGIYNKGDSGVATATIINVLVSGNSAGIGGGIVNDGRGTLSAGRAELTIDGSTINNNGGEFSTAGGIWNYGFSGSAILTIRNSSISENFASGVGGGILNQADDSIANATITNCEVNGNRGGGIYNWRGATLTLTDSRVNGNQSFFAAGGIHNNRANTTIIRSTIAGNEAASEAGGIRNAAGFLTLSESSVNGNSGPRVGAIENDNSGSAVIRNSTISNNFQSSNPDYPTDLTRWAAILSGGSLTLTNSTVSGNTADIADFVVAIGNSNNFCNEQPSTLAVNNSTIADNKGISILTGGCDVSDNLVDIANTIIKADPAGMSFQNFNGTIISHGYNLSSDPAGGDGTTGPGGFLNGPGDIRNTDPQLGPLQNNGGPTMTHALLSNSWAIDAGDPNFNPDAFTPPLLYDQRNSRRFPRVVNGRIDIGAFELTQP